MALREVTGDRFQADVLESARPVVVHFWAAEEVTCHVMERVLESLRDTESDRYEIVNVDVWENPVLVQRFSVNAVPTAILFTGGEERARVVGIRKRSSIREVFGKFLPQAVIDLREYRTTARADADPRTD